MTDRLTRVCVVLFAAFGAAGATCSARSADMQTASLRVALRTSVADVSWADVLAGTTVGVVRLSPAPATIASVPAGQLLPSFRTAVAGRARPATSPALTLPLPGVSPGELRGMPFDIVFFNDLNGDGLWQGGEPYATAWSGGRGGYRVTLDTASPPAGPRWQLLEGGEPPAVHPTPADVVVYIDPVQPAVER